MPARKKQNLIWSNVKPYFTWANLGLFIVMPVVITFIFGVLTGRIKSETGAAGVIAWSLVGTQLANMIRSFKKKPDAE